MRSTDADHGAVLAPTGETPFEVLVRLDGRVRRAMRRACLVMAGDPNLADEAYSDVALERIHRIVELYDPTKRSSLDNYVLRTLYLYTRKWAMRSRKFITGRVPRQTVPELPGTTNAPSDAAVEVHSILDRLSDYDRWLLENRFMRGYTLREMRIALGVSKGCAAAHINQALRRARELIAECHEEYNG